MQKLQIKNNYKCWKIKTMRLRFQSFSVTTAEHLRSFSLFANGDHREQPPQRQAREFSISSNIQPSFIISMSLDSQVLLGDMGTGKSSLVLRFVKGQFLEFQVFL